MILDLRSPLAAAALTLLTACATSSSQLPVGARHFQIRNSAEGAVMLQISLPSREHCAYVLKAVRDAMGDKVRFASCSDTSAAAVMHAYAEVLDRSNQLLMHLETVSMTECVKAINGIMAGPARSTNDLVAPCATK